METKTCKECGQDFPVTEEYFYKVKSKKDGFNNKCKECCNELSRIYREKNIEKVKEKDKIYYQNNKDKTIKRQTEYYYKNQEQYSQYYYENKDDIMKYQKEYKNSHIEGIKAIKTRGRHKRRALFLGNGGSYTENEWKDCLIFFEYKCCYSGQELNENNLTVEHIIPIGNGGTSYINNIICCDSKINASKGKKELEEWYRKQSYFTEERLAKIYEWIEINS